MNTIIGANIRKWRKKRKMSQEDLGKILGLHQTAVCRIESGGQRLTAAEMWVVMQEFRITANDVFEGVGE